MEKIISIQMTCDVLVVGNGGAGIRAAVTAADLGQEVLLLGESGIGKAGSTFYPLSHEWGMLYAVDKEDAEQFAGEILGASGGCMNEKLGRKLAEESCGAFARLRDAGISFVPMKDLGITGCFGREPRGAFLKDMEEMIRFSEHEVAQRENIRFRSGMTVVSLVVSENRCCGAVSVDSQGQLVHIAAKSVVLACGGGEGLYEYGASYGHLYGGAYAMAARHGVRLVNLEFIQFVHGSVTPKRGINYYPFSYIELPDIRNGKGEKCLKKYLPEGMTEEECILAHAAHGPFSADSKGKYLEYAMVGEAEAGNGTGLIFSPDPGRVSGKRYQLWDAFLKRLGLDTGTPMALYPFAQGFNGGILLHGDMKTDMEGLYACGESAGGCHGPNRMGGLCILATQVFGEAAGREAAQYAGRRGMEPLPEAEVEEQLQREFGHPEASESGSPAAVLRRIRSTMQEYGCLHRSEEGLEEAMRQLRSLRTDPMANLGRKDTAEYFRVYNALEAAELIVHSMRQRRESRGCHDRSDYKERDSKQEKMNWVTISQGEIIGGVLNEEP